VPIRCGQTTNRYGQYGDIYWQEILMPYVKNAPLFKCPSAGGWFYGYDLPSPYTPPDSYNCEGGIGLNWYCADIWLAADPSFGIVSYLGYSANEGSISAPASKAVLMETDRQPVAGPNEMPYMPTPITYQMWINTILAGGGPFGIERHNSVMNVLFADQHAKAQKGSQITPWVLDWRAP
jgi:prepilin-type processing-associated H-X9-DG protein